MTLNLAPMVDVMMCLIVFFLLASKLATELQPVELPWAEAARVVEPSELGNTVTITVRPETARGDTAEYLVTDWDGQRIVELSLESEQIERLLAARARRARESGDTLRCVVRADREVRYAHVEVVLRACGLADISNVVFPANKGLDPEETS